MARGADAQVFRILALSGGGARGIFQAFYLSLLQDRLKSHGFASSLHEDFDLIAGTSTGALVALALAAEVDVHRIAELYKTSSREVFAPRRYA